MFLFLDSQTALGRFQDLPLNCHSCSGEDCNASNRGKINKCNGNVAQSCATAFATNGNVIARGCSDQLKTTCDDNTNTCLYCQSSGCNEALALNEYVDCIECDTQTNKNCLYDVTKITGRRKCYKSCMTSLYIRTKTDPDPAYELVRTCLDDLDLDDLEACENGNRENCKACSTENCNTDKVPEKPRLICSVCEGDCSDFEDMECSAYRANDECFTEFDENNDISKMGCRSSLARAYETAKKRSLYYCSNNSCNSKYIAVPRNCASCNSTNNVACVNNVNSIAVKQCANSPYTECATYLNADGALVRDCVYNIADDELFDKCLSNNNTECEICSVNGCNKEVFPADRLSCLQCDTTTDSNCDVGGKNVQTAYCSIYLKNDTCVTEVENGLTRRGCQSQIKCDTLENGMCRSCSGVNCNTVNLIKNQIGEPGRWQDLPLACYTCVGNECTTGTGSSQKCNGNNMQNCMTVFGIDGKVMRRGCSDDVLATNGTFCEANEDNCIGCKSNDCNSATQLSEYIDCYFCDSADIETCATDFTSGRTRKCKDACMVTLYASSLETNPSYEISRSCLDDKDAVDQQLCSNKTDTNCVACTTSNCNIQDLPEDRLSCYKCTDESCQTQIFSKCRSYQPDDQCFILYNNSISNVINMGCRSELPTETIESLTKDKNFWVCDSNNCNNLAILPTKKSCLVCNSESDKRCISEPSALSTFEICSNVPYVECMTRVRKGNLLYALNQIHYNLNYL